MRRKFSISAIRLKSERLQHSQSGFTLIEIGIAIFILGVVFTGILAIFPIGIESTKRIVRHSNASILSELALSELRAADVVGIVGTMTAGQAYTYPDISNINKDRLFEDSSGNRVFAQYSWQAVLKSIKTTDTNLIRAQIAIFFNVTPSEFGTGTADFTQGSTNVPYTTPLPPQLTSKQYIREDNEAFWSRIDTIDTDTSTIILEGPFSGTSGAGLAFTTTDDIIDIYETMLAKH
ncbi:MAG: type II secretion system GspH family protein [Candidatus Scalindua sp.]|nr:type II secretion system GspH family protein [Candidatus Scalindua sp.]